MEEKILLQSKNYNIKKVIVITTILTILTSVIILLSFYIEGYSYHKENYDMRIAVLQDSFLYDSYTSQHSRSCGCYVDTAADFTRIHPTVTSYAKCCWGNEAILNTDEITISLMPLTLIILIVILYFWLRSYSLTVTDKRVYGKTAFGKQVDLPLDSISAIGTSALKGISVGTSSGKIKFKLIKNQAEMHSVMGNLLKERQGKNQIATKETPIPQTIIKQTSADELKKFKELLDMGAISQEEFDQKKKELLGL